MKGTGRIVEFQPPDSKALTEVSRRVAKDTTALLQGHYGNHLLRCLKQTRAALLREEAPEIAPASPKRLRSMQKSDTAAVWDPSSSKEGLERACAVRAQVLRQGIRWIGTMLVSRPEIRTLVQITKDCRYGFQFVVEQLLSGKYKDKEEVMNSLRRATSLVEDSRGRHLPKLYSPYKALTSQLLDVVDCWYVDQPQCLMESLCSLGTYCDFCNAGFTIWRSNVM